MQESKEIGPHITTKAELDALYRNVKESLGESERTDQDKIDIFSDIYDKIDKQAKKEINNKNCPYSVYLTEDSDGNKNLQVSGGADIDYMYTIAPNSDFRIK